MTWQNTIYYEPFITLAHVFATFAIEHTCSPNNKNPSDSQTEIRRDEIKQIA